MKQPIKDCCVELGDLYCSHEHQCAVTEILEEKDKTVKRVILMSLGFQPVAELVPEAVRGLTRIRLGSVEFIRRPDLDTDVSEVWMELPREAIHVPERNVVRWFD